MSKPILWLGPLEELDVDFDPLLGRSARQVPAQTSSSSPVTFDASRSVFDDPVLDDATAIVTAPQTPYVAPARNDLGTPHLKIVEPGILREAQSLEPVADYPSVETPLTTETPNEPIVVAAPVSNMVQEELEFHAPVEEAQTTDFTHNNEPIPEREMITSPTSAQSGDDLGNELLPASIVAAPRKSFFTSLFAQREIAPSDNQRSASINDIWAKATPELEPVTETETGPETEAEPAPVNEITDAQTLELSEPQENEAQPSPKADTPLRGRNIWADIDSEDNQPSDDALVHGDANAPEAPLEAALLDEVESNITVEEPAPDTSELTASHDVVDFEADDQNPADASEPEPEAFAINELSEPVTDGLDAPAPIEPAVVEPIVAEIVPVEPAHVEVETPLPAQEDSGQHAHFQNAFNADQFWALPRGTNLPHPDGELPSQEGTDNVKLEGQAQREVPESVASVQAREISTRDDVKIAAAAVQSGSPQTGDLSQAQPRKVRPKGTGARRKKKVKTSYIGAFFGTFLFGVALFMTVVSSLAAFGYPFDMISSYRWYWVILAVLAAGIWGLSRGWKMVGASFLVMGANLFVTVPATGKAPTGGSSATAVVGWANVAGNSDALARVFKDAEKKKATLLMLAETPAGALVPPQGWSLIEAPVAGDPTAIAVLSRSSWRAVTIPGEPTMARSPAGDITIIGVHPQDAQKGRRRTPNRDALINRAGTRAGIQDGPTVVLGDFNAAAWDKAMTQFRNYGNVTRVRCGGWVGTTLTQWFGLVGVATDHAYVRDVKVTHCQLGGSLSGGNHKPIWLYVKPQPAPPAPPPQP